MRSLVLAAVLLLPRLGSADEVKVAVIPGIVVNIDAARVDALTQELAEALHTELEVDATGGVEVRRRLPREGLPPDCVANQACITDVAHRLDANQLLFVVMIDTGTGGAIQVDSTWIDPVAHRSASRPAIDIATIADARARFAAAAVQLLPDAKVRPKPAPHIGRMSDEIPRHFTLPAYVTAGAAVAGLGVGVTLGLTTRSRYQDCEHQVPMGIACSTNRKDSIRRLALLADASWAVAIGATIATAVLYSSSAEKPRLIVEPTPGGAAVTAVGSF
ncbi:MAG: hypothetical protein E6J91_24310 [Deltaproteobacteria bacterium]|nr:MAG: hypothetical protein E6J91_24310 [Deltaproteobacteria bacterium]